MLDQPNFRVKTHFSDKTTAIPNRLKLLRMQKDWMMAYVAKSLDMPYGSYGSLESGHSLASQEVLDKICVLFECAPAEVYPFSFLVDLISAVYKQRVAKVAAND